MNNIIISTEAIANLNIALGLSCLGICALILSWQVCEDVCGRWSRKSSM